MLIKESSRQFCPWSIIVIEKTSYYIQSSGVLEDFSMITSKLGSRAQTTIPQSIRTALRLKQGDRIAYSIDGGKVILSRAKHISANDPFAVFTEWDSEADRQAYADL